MSNAAISDVLVDHIDSLALSPSVDAVKPEQPYKPKVGRPYLDMQYAPNETLTLFTGDDDPKQYQGFLQITVVYPRNQGSALALSIADAIVAHYKKGTKLRGEGGTTVRVIREPWASLPLPDDAWFRIPVSIPYLSMN